MEIKKVIGDGCTGALKEETSNPQTLLLRNVPTVHQHPPTLLGVPKIPERQDGDSRQRTRRFAVDFCYDSKDPEGCSQEAVYNEIGSEVLHSMFEGYNACVLAYGHSASGKTYTIMGLQDDPGLTPRLCQGLFEKLKGKSPDGRVQVQVVVSFLEIYNEKVRDLLGNEEPGATSGNFSLRVREHPKLGPYVQGLSEHSVTDKRKLLELLAAGNRKRITAATENNSHSSRSHAVFTIRFRQSDGQNYETEKSSKVHFVDLAGSLPQISRQETLNERASSSQSKARLKEGANINKSLVTLGNVISALAESYESTLLLKEHSTSKSWQPFVPYRDSVLTWLLKDTLGGNSNTIMIATVSPASGCLSETVNTLRYAKRTKRIVNQPIVNEDPKIRTIRELRKEISRLKGLLLTFQSLQESDSTGSPCLFDDDSYQSPECKWQEPERMQITVKEVDGNWGRGAEESEEGKEGLDSAAATSEYERSVRRGQREAPPGGDACKIAHEKKSDVNVSVNDSFSHETQTFSDSLESFSSVFLKTGCSCDADDDDDDDNGSGELDAPGLTRESCSYENLSKQDFSVMLHRSRPDLIKGISGRSKDPLPSGSSSNLSHSTSENSLNSSGSPEAQPSGKRQQQQQQQERLGAEVRTGRRDPVQIAMKKKEIVERVTDRLYVTKKKPDAREKAASKGEKDEEDDGELEELKLCKRARMKLFDLSRKLAMTRKFKKTVDSDTQTESLTATIRMKEKCVTTEPSEAFETPEDAPKKEKPCVIMNQVFIPRTSNYVVKCGRVVRIEPPAEPDRHETATQTATEEPLYKSANTSPIKLSPREEDCFSEDSLELEEATGGTALPEDQTSIGSIVPEPRVSFRWPPDDSKTKPTKDPEESLFIGLPLSVFRKENLAVSNSSLESRKDENLSSENSFTSFEGTEVNSSSETSSEDFVFYESPKEVPVRPKTTSDRELYTITENSEQSDPSDAFSPVQSQASSLNIAEQPKPEGSGQNLDSKVPKGDSTASVDITKTHAEEFAPKSDPQRKSEVKQINWSDLHSNAQKQYLNLNITTGGKTTPFSVDTHLFKKVSTRDQSTDTMFTSADSITFVFMGPAKPKSSVLMEIIKRSLGKSERRSRSRGVQCDGNLVRSVSVDTAMLALSRIAKNQERSPEMQRTTSLGAVTPEEMVAILGQGKLQKETSCQCDFEADLKKSAIKCSVGTNTTADPKKMDTKKSVSWSGETRLSATADDDEPDFDLSYEDTPEVEVEESNEGDPLRFGTPERRVRFVKPETRNLSEIETTDTLPLTAFLKEATELLKSINSRSKYQFLDEESEDNRRTEGRRGGLKKSRREAMTRSKTESSLERNSTWRSRGSPTSEGTDENLTWPRRRPTTGKPPTGMKSKPCRSPLLFQDARNLSQSSRLGSSGQSWNLSNLSMEAGARETPTKHLSRFYCDGKWCRDEGTSPRSNVPKLNFDSIAELETSLEESCRRLEMAAEQDRMREEILETKKGMFECRKPTPGIGNDAWEERKGREVVKRRQTEECSGGCTCRATGSDSCKYLWLKLCRSSFELNSFGPGSSHCRQFCIFCRKKDAESYSSALSLNSECSLGLCRLNYYGFCPCSPVRLQHVASSPRAYMQHLLALRRQIVNETKQKTSGEVPNRNREGSWSGRADPLSTSRDF